jgi:hypothetical protein
LAFAPAFIISSNTLAPLSALLSERRGHIDTVGLSAT